MFVTVFDEMSINVVLKVLHIYDMIWTQAKLLCIMLNILMTMVIHLVSYELRIPTLDIYWRKRWRVIEILHRQNMTLLHPQIPNVLSPLTQTSSQ